MSNSITTIKSYINSDSVKARLEDMLGKRASAFSNSIINVVKNNDYLQKCAPDSVMNSAMIAASLNMPIDPALGFAAIVPYGTAAQFQLMYKGIIQLCIRSGQYETIHNAEVYKDEIKSHNPITGQTLFNDPETYQMRRTGKPEDVAGFYAMFKLTAGFRVSAYMTMDEVMAHAKKFSKAYQYDLKKNKKSSVWSTDPVSMGKKTVIKQLLSKYGIMSVEMQDAFCAENDSFETAQVSAEAAINSDMGAEVVDAEFVPAQQAQETPGTGQPEWVGSN